MGCNYADTDQKLGEQSGNTTEQTACPFLNSEPDGPLHIAVESDTVSGTVFCEQLRFFDLGKRSFYILGRLGYFDTIEIADAVQEIFDYHEGLIS